MVVRVVSPTAGILWHRPEPGSDAYCVPGDRIVKGQPLALVEVMKMFAPVESEVDGTFVEYSIGDGEPIDSEQPIAVIDPA